MADIGKTDAAGLPDGWRNTLERLRQALLDTGAHPAHTLVLLPYAQLLVLARDAWAACAPPGFAPRFETTASWARSLGAPPAEMPDVTCDTACDTLTAQGLLERTGLGEQRGELAAPLVEAAHQLVRAVAAVPPGARGAWAERVREALGTGSDAAQLRFETATAHIAFEWALSSACATDVLFTPQAGAGGVHCLVVLQGLQAEPLVDALCGHWQAEGWSVARIALDQPGAAAAARLHAASDAEDEAERAAACVLARVREGAVPVALVANDRALTRRIGALLSTHRLAVQDESGWKLSTTRSAAQVLAALRACARHASGDEVLDWLKNAPSFAAPAVAALEAALRRAGVREWRSWLPPAGDRASAYRTLLDDVGTLRGAMERPRPLASWLAGLRTLLQGAGQWRWMEEDPAGQRIAEVLRLDEAALAAFSLLLAESAWAARRLDLNEFTAWVRRALEAESFVPEPHRHGSEPDVVVLSMSQLLARPFGAVVVPGCDEVRLPASPELQGPWSSAQREALGLPARAALQAEIAAAWRQVLQAPQADVLWRSGDEGGETLQPSPLVLALQAVPGAAVDTADPRALRTVAAVPVAPPQPRGDRLPVERLSASAYEDLRKCPYRFFALRQLGLQETDELDNEIDKRDFGLWLHAVLRLFHEGLSAEPEDTADALRARLDAAADAATAAQGLADDEFLPFGAAWPRVRDGYLDWHLEHAASGLRFERGEEWREQPLGPVLLVGQIDRLDLHPGLPEEEGTLVIDYKTEGLQTTSDRIKRPGEDTQLAFYAALLPHGSLRAAYVNVGERGGTRLVEQVEVVAARDGLVEGILSDVARISEGAVLPPLGEGAVCDYCSARGLCRKDFWSVV
ncbi:MAG: PD-(D/E)XK nuclease family protein [Pseudomonadota bacterium]